MKQKKDIPHILAFVPHTGTLNLGDYIIWDNIKSILTNILKGENVMLLTVASHQPLSHYHRYFIKRLRNKQIPFIVLLSGANPFHLYYSPISSFNQWAVGVVDIPYLKNRVLLFGAGTIRAIPNIKRRISSLYSEKFWKLVLTDEFTHEVRDKESLELASYLGIPNVTNLGCPTLWKLTGELIKSIPTTKSTRVVTTITSNKRDPLMDMMMLDTLLESYEEVYLWPQGAGDILYFNTLQTRRAEYNKVRILPPTLWAYDQVLSGTKIDYVGTRVHGGIRALQHKRRAIIIAVDHRAVSFSRNFGLYSISRSRIDALQNIIESKVKVRLRIPERKIKTYLQEFKEYVTSM